MTVFSEHPENTDGATQEDTEGSDSGGENSEQQKSTPQNPGR